MDPLIQKWTIVADEASRKRMYEWVEATAKEGARRAYESAKKENEKNNKREEALFKNHLRRMQRVQDAQLRELERQQKHHLDTMAQNQKAADAKDLERQKQKNRERTLIIDDRLKDERNLERLGHELYLSRQKRFQAEILEEVRRVNAKKLQRQKAADALYLEEQREVNRKAARDQREAENQRLADQRKAHDLRLVDLKEASAKALEAERQGNRHRLENHRQHNRIELEQERSSSRMQENVQKAGLARQQAILNAALRQDIIRTQAAADRSVNAHRSMWSLIRTITETGSRFMSSITQSALRSMGNAVGYGFRRITGEYRQGTAQQEAILRDSLNDQTRAVTVAMARQEGAVRSFQNTVNTGAAGSLMNLRNVALGLGGYISARAIFGPVADYQQTQIAFEGLLGSARGAEAFLDQLRNFARVTPFEFQGVADAARRLLAVNFAESDIIPTLTTIGNVAANLGVGTVEINGVIRALGQMKGKGKASAEELNQISEQLPGFSAVQAIAESLGITVSETFDMMRKGALPADVAIEAIIDGMERMPGAAGAMERQSQTLNGRLSTLRDTVKDMLIDAINPFIDRISDAVGVFTGWIESLFRGEGIWAIVRSGLLGISIAMGAILAQKGAVATMQLMGTALKLIAANPITALAVTITTIATILYRHNDDFREFVNGFLGRIGDWVQEYSGPVIDALSSLADGISGIVSSVLEGDWDGALTQLESLRDTLFSAVESAADFLIDFGEEAWTRWDEWLEAGGLGDLADSIKWRILDAVIRVRDGIRDIDWDRFLAPSVGALGAALVSLLAFNFPLWLTAGLVGGVALLLTNDKVRSKVTEKLTTFFEDVVDTLSEWFEGQNWTPLATTLAIGLGSALVLAFAAPTFAVPALIVTAIAGAIAAAAGNPKARKLFDEAATQISEWAGDAFEGIDWVRVYGTVLAGIEKVTAKITKWITLFVTSPEFVKAVATITVGLAGIAGAVIVGFFEGLFKALTKRNDQVYDAITEWLGGLFKDFHPFDKDGALRGIIPDVSWGDLFGPIIDGLKSAWKGLVDGLNPSNWLPKGPKFASIGNTIWDLMKPGFGYLFEQLDAVSFGFLGIGLRMADGFVGSFTNLGERILKAIMKGLGSATNFAQDFVNAIISGINTGLIDKLNDINIGFDPPVGPSFSWTPGLPHIPEVQLAKGGIVTRPTIALIGEAGPEAVVPLTGNAAGSIPFTISFDATAVAAQVEAIVAIMAPMGERLIAATTPGMRDWAAAIETALTRILTGFEAWGVRMVDLAVSISTAITDGITDGLREGRREVVGITRGYARSLVGALNPLLTGIGESAIQLNFAKGGIAEAHQGAQVHVFNEGKRGRGSSHGEAYIPFDPTNRHRSRDLASETVRRLGGNVQWFAEGGITAPTVQPGQRVPGVSGDVVGLVAEFARRLSTWSLANGGGYHVGSGYRSIAEQTRLYQRYLAGVRGQAPAAPPGRSMHNFGLASDGNHWRNLRPEEFGLRFPMSYEPWHVEPVEGKALLGDTDFPSFQPLPRPPGAGNRGWLSRVAAKLMAYVYDKALAHAGGLTYDASVPTLGSASASPAILAAIRTAMRIVGVPASWLGPLLTLISRESSFNPNAYNGILGATGLMQTIPSTFAAHALPGHGNIRNPIDNVIAGLRYIISRYGTIFNVGQAVSPSPTKGYRDGGIIERDGLYRLGEGNRREAVLPLENRSRLVEILRRTGLDRVIADALGPGIDLGIPDLSAMSRSASGGTPMIGEVKIEQNINTAGNARTTARLVAKGTDDALRNALLVAP